MKKKKIAGFVIGLAGIALTVYALYCMKRIANAKETIQGATTPFSGNEVGDFAGDAMMAKASEYDTTVKVMLGGGILLIIIGGVMACCRCKEPQKRK